MSRVAIAAIRPTESGAGLRMLGSACQEKVNYNPFLWNLISRL